MLRRQSPFSRLVAAALVTLTVFGTIPRIGCLCADGARKFFCQRLRSRAATGPCACGDSAAQVLAGRSAGSPQSRSVAGCRNRRADTRTEGRWVASSSACRLVVESRFSRTDGRNLAELMPPHQAGYFDGAIQSGLRVAGKAILATRLTSLPPPDIVIAFGVLLI
ncbi:MAG: hypothetical protein ACT4QC_09450 [Planctomycetaceae bacterium]